MILEYQIIKIKVDHTFGILLIGETKKFFILLSSPKPKHLKMPNNMLDIFKINDGKLGVLNINNMIPIPENELIMFDIDSILDKKYSVLLKKQIIYINKDRVKIYKKATMLYKQYVNNKLTDKILKRCCNFFILENKCIEWENNK